MADGRTRPDALPRRRDRRPPTWQRLPRRRHAIPLFPRQPAPNLLPGTHAQTCYPGHMRWGRPLHTLVPPPRRGALVFTRSESEHFSPDSGRSPSGTCAATATNKRSNPMYAVELLAICPRVIGQETPSKASVRGQTRGEQGGNRRFRLLNSPVDCAAGLFHGPVAGTRAEHHRGSAWHFTGDGHMAFARQPVDDGPNLGRARRGGFQRSLQHWDRFGG